jgi:hypothetical protein
MKNEICFEEAQVCKEVRRYEMKTRFYNENSIRESLKQGGHV